MSLHPDYPLVTGDYQLTSEWAVMLPVEFNRRIDDGSLVLWRPGLTFWIIAWGNDHNSSTEAQLSSILDSANNYRGEEQTERTGALIRLTYELPEEDNERPKSEYTSISGYVISQSGHLQISAYFDTPDARTLGYKVLHSVRYVA